MRNRRAGVLGAVLFEWGYTLVHPCGTTSSSSLVIALRSAAMTRISPPWRALMLGEAHGRRPYRALLAEIGVEDPDTFIEREHREWQLAYAVLARAPALLASLRERGLKTGLVSNAWPDSGRLLRADADAVGLGQFLDAMVFSEEAGVRKPAPGIFLRACGELGVEPTATLFVGDSLVVDVRGAADVGMKTVQAMWFRADDDPDIEPDFRAFEAMDVLNVVGRSADDPH